MTDKTITLPEGSKVTDVEVSKGDKPGTYDVKLKRSLLGKLLVLRGLPGSGKTTYAKTLIPDYIRVSRDDYRNMMWDGKFSREKEDVLVDCMLLQVRSLLGRGFNVVLDNIHLDPQHIELAKTCLVPSMENKSEFFEIKDFTTSVEECIRRDKERGGKVGEDVIRNLAKKWDWPPCS